MLGAQGIVEIRGWYYNGLVRPFNIGRVIVGESETFVGGLDWLREHGVEVIDLDSPACKELLAT